MVKCPKCKGELRIERVSILEETVDVDLVCVENQEHKFFARIHDEDLIEQ
jgi:hypothetical protein